MKKFFEFMFENSGWIFSAVVFIALVIGAIYESTHSF
jgi:hypothetical protein